MAGGADVVAIGAHPDDVELIALPEIAAARAGDIRLAAIVCCDGARAPRRAGEGPRTLAERRRDEARASARLGGYSSLALLGHASGAVRGPGWQALARELTALLAEAGAASVLTHAPTDRHPTHVAVCAAVVSAARGLPLERRPRRLLGCEVWGGLDWLGAEAVLRDVSGLERLSDDLLGCHRSQLDIKAYDAAVAGRRRANATFRDPSAPDGPRALDIAIDLSECLEPGGRGLREVAVAAATAHAERIAARLAPYSLDEG